MTGLLLINLGTPSEPTVKAVRHYLREFLSDPLVIDINPLARWMLVNLIIVPFRAPKSLKAYQKIWMKEGSPLLFYSRALKDKVQEKLGTSHLVEFAMRYGEPSIEPALKKFKEARVGQIKVFPLYPQYALSSTQSTINEVKKIASRLGLENQIKIIPSFYQHPLFIKAFAERGRPVLESLKPDHILFSFHGLPERQIHKVHPDFCLLKENCCDDVNDRNQNCYRAQCFATARAIARELNLQPTQYSVSFQSRLGRTPWIKPYTDLVLADLPKKGKKRLAVFCPAFVADCLETLEEIGIRNRELFISKGGEDLRLIPSLNDHPEWVKAIASLGD